MRAVLGLSAVSALIFLALDQEPSVASRLEVYRPAVLVKETGERYSGSSACRSCHPSAYTSWYRSYHRTMTQVATPESVLGPFDGRVLVDTDRKYRVFKHNGGFFVDMPVFGTEGVAEAERLVRPVVMTTGSHHMQAYWIPMPSFGEEIPKEERQAFKTLCSRCHGPDARGGRAPGLIDASLGKSQIIEGLNTPSHVSLDRNTSEYGQAVSYANRVQYTGRLAQFPFVYLIKAKRWAHEDHTFLQAPDPLDESEPYGDRWSDGCDQCHSVRASFKWVPGQQVGEANVAELGIACEACHGPGKAHIARFTGPLDRYSGRIDDTAEDDIVNPSKLDHRKASHVCAQCHAELVLSEDGDDFYPGNTIQSFGHVVQYLPEAPPDWLANHLAEEPNLLNDAFWKDGTIRVAGRDFNGLAKTGCFTRGTMSCLSCHTMHGGDPNDQLKAKAIGNDVCVECHPKEGADISAHTHHPADSAGSLCYNCHMPHTTIGLLGVIRAHRVDSPNAKTSAWTGRPTACNLCHLDKTLAEVAESLTEWYEQEPLKPTKEHSTRAASILGLLKGDAVVRATYAWHMGWPPAQAASGTNWIAPYLVELLNDPYSSVRFVAGKAISSLPGFKQFAYDYIGTDQTYERAASTARAQWQETAPKLNRPELLLRQGQVDTETLHAIKKNRDDTPVRVNE